MSWLKGIPLHFKGELHDVRLINFTKATIGSLDRAYSMVHKDVLRVTQIQREKWPIQDVTCGGFETSFFKSARLVGAFRVHETIYYDWLPPRTVPL